MVLEWKIFLNQFTQKQVLLKVSSMAFLFFLMNRQPAYPHQVISMLICYAASFGSLEYMVNVFGLDGWAFYLHYLSTRPLWGRLIRRVMLGFMVQLVWAILLSAYFYTRSNSLNFQYHCLILAVVLLQNFAIGCIFSAAFPRAIPKTLEKKVFRAHPGLGLSVASVLAILTPAAFYMLFRLMPASAVLTYIRIYLFILLLFAPVSAFWAARILRKGVFPKLQAVTSEY